MNFQELYEGKKVSLDEALGYIRSNDNVCFAGDCNEPKIFAQNLHKIAPGWRMSPSSRPVPATLSLSRATT